jgi:hypothetical protein
VPDGDATTLDGLRLRLPRLRARLQLPALQLQLHRSGRRLRASLTVDAADGRGLSGNRLQPRLPQRHQARRERLPDLSLQLR